MTQGITLSKAYSAGVNPFDPASNIVPGQTGALTGDSSVTPAVIRVHDQPGAGLRVHGPGRGRAGAGKPAHTPGRMCTSRWAASATPGPPSKSRARPGSASAPR